MPRMDEDSLLSHLQRLEENSAQYVLGPVRAARNEAMREYFRRPYGNEEEGWSQIVTSDVQDTIEWMLAYILDLFVSTDDAVVFDPNRESDVEGAQQATDACNYVFYKSNAGLLVLYTAFKDALQSKNCAVHWRMETLRSKEVQTVRGASLDVLTALMTDDETGKIDGKIEEAEQYEEQVKDSATGLGVVDADRKPMMQTLMDGKISRVVERKVVRVEAFEPENLLVKRDWTSPMLQECPYVARIMPVTLSELRQMGFEVDADDLRASDQPNGGIDTASKDRTGGSDQGPETGSDISNGEDDESQTEGFLRIEWVLVDYDGDGISERREVYRLDEKILSNKECSQVPIATGSPIMVQHRWLGMSVAEMVSDLQLLRTELTRGMVNNAYLASNPRKTVLVDSNGAPQASIDDLLDYRPGGITQVKQLGAIGVDQTPFIGNQMFPIFQYLDEMQERRTGLTKQRMGMDPNAIRQDRTLGETRIVDNASQARMKMIGRLFAETIVKPMFQGMLRLLTEGPIEPISMRLRGKFVEYDPNEWRDSYDMTINVGTGTGDRETQAAILAGVSQDQMALAPTPLGAMLLTPQQIYATRAKRLELAGMKNVGDYFKEPGLEARMPTPPPAPPDPKMMVEQMKLQAEASRFGVEKKHEVLMMQLEDQREQRRAQAQDAVQQANDQRDAQARQLEAGWKQQLDAGTQRIKELELALDRYKVDEDNRTRIQVALIAHPEGPQELDPETGEVRAKPDPLEPVMGALGAIAGQLTAPTEIERDPMTGRPIGYTKGGVRHVITHDEKGRMSGSQPLQ